MLPRILSAALGVAMLTVGCTAAGVRVDPAASADHPANPDAPAATAPPPGPSAQAAHASHSAGAGPAATRPSTQPAPYVCPMHPKVTSAAAGACPQCGMALVKRPAATSPAPATSHDHNHDHGGRR
jgi:hypothetical protein